jgi:hypothetical protein
VRSHRRRSWWEAWKKPQRPSGQSHRAWKTRPKELLVRRVRFQVHVRGFRTHSVTVVTSLFNAKTHPDSAIAEL